MADEGTQVGLTTSGPHQAHSIDTALTLPSSPFSAVQTTWNILERSAQRSLAAAADHGWTVIVKEAMANGRLAPGGTPEVDRLAVAAGTTSDALAIGAALAQDWAHVILSGAVTAAHPDEGKRTKKSDISHGQIGPPGPVCVALACVRARY